MEIFLLRMKKQDICKCRTISILFSVLSFSSKIIIHRPNKDI